MDGRRRATFALILATSFSACSQKEQANPPAKPDPIHAEASAKAYCSRCHLYPEPSALEQHAWVRILPRMRLLAGLDRPDPERMHNPELAGKTNLFPAAPLIPPTNWPHLERFYLENSPPAQPVLARPLIPLDLTLFKADRPEFSLNMPVTTFVGIDSEEQTITFADGKTETVYIVNNRGEVRTSINASNIITSIRTFGTNRVATGIGDFFPSDDRLGELLLFSNNVPTRLLLNLPRITHVEPADLNGDGHLDFALSVFGNLEGRFAWFESLSNSFRENVLFNKPGALKSIAYDFNKDSRLDLAVLVAQETEAMLIFLNEGDGRFKQTEAFRRPPYFGHTDFKLADINGDGQVDLIVANGDNADFLTEPRPYHGIRIYTNDAGRFTESYFFPFYGAYNLEVADFDGDGDLDIAAVAFFADFPGPHPEPFVYLENRGGLKFEPHTFAGAEIGRWLTLAAGDVDGDGDIDLVLGPVAEMPDRVPSRWQQLWQEQSPSYLLLRNEINSVPLSAMRTFK